MGTNNTITTHTTVTPISTITTATAITTMVVITDTTAPTTTTQLPWLALKFQTEAGEGSQVTTRLEQFFQGFDPRSPAPAANPVGSAVWRVHQSNVLTPFVENGLSSHVYDAARCSNVCVVGK